MFPKPHRQVRAQFRNEMTESPPSEMLSLAKRLIAYETCDERSIFECAGFVEAWLEARDIEATREEVRGCRS